MCGIFGILNTEAGPVDLPSFERAAKAIAHRGPDDEGYLFVNRADGRWAHFAGEDSPLAVRRTYPLIEKAGGWIDSNRPDLAIAHRRFSIISPAPDGHQPFRDSRNRVAVALNGEIYNYLELREELKAEGHVFRTATDTEALVEAYLAWGDRCFERLNGMWAIALYDFDRRELILSRDRAGERPLYWIRRPEAIYFASEIKALLDCGEIYADRRVHDDAVYNFLHQAVADLDEKTFFAGIESLPIASVVRIDSEGRINARRFWQMPQARATEADQKPVPELCEELRSLLRDSVALRLRADVPVNVALSGGMDSSSVVAMAASLRGEGVDTYTVRFEEEEWNEWPYADAVARKFKVRNLVIDPPGDWMWGHLERFVRDMEEPFHAPDLLPDHVIRRMLASRGIRVNLSGIGGDEIFAGYDHYRRFRALDLKRSGNTLRAVKEMVFASDTSPLRGAARLIQGKWRSIRGRWVQAQSEDLFSQAMTFGLAPRLRELPQSVEERLRADVEWSLLPYWLRAGDKSSMAIPIEVRYPFLDHRLIEFAARLPVSYLIRNGWMKWLLRKAMEDALPREVVWRRKKMGFPFPIAEWVRSSAPDLRTIFAQMENPYLSRSFWTERLTEAIECDTWFVWRVLSFELWHRRFIRNLPVLPDSLTERAEVASHEPAACALS